GTTAADGTVSGGFSRAYLHHLERCGEMLAPMLATIHNLHYYLELMRGLRDAIAARRLEDFVAAFYRGLGREQG
ncbi:MAG TPA: tRNA-guanine transglycosylase, partial [Nevskia sp.]|nr:tRNA-guanine transglycosylase [Nevskia sp.]